MGDAKEHATYKSEGVESQNKGELQITNTDQVMGWLENINLLTFILPPGRRPAKERTVI